MESVTQMATLTLNTALIAKLAAKFNFDSDAFILAAMDAVSNPEPKPLPKPMPMPPGYFVFAEDNYLGSGFSRQKIAALAASSQQLAEKWEDLSEKERSEWNECAIRAPALKPTGRLG
jgi:hypothetical protein